MITVLETTVWEGPARNHRYILSDDKSWLYGYIRDDQDRPDLFTKPMRFDARGRQFKLLVKTRDVDPDVQTWDIKGSKGAVHTVSLRDDVYRCSCPAAKYRGGVCKHIESVKNRQ